MKSKIILLIVFLGGFMLNLSAQEFIDGSSGFSRKKDSHFILKDGTKITGLLHKWGVKKGLITEITVKTEDGKKTKIEPSKIDHMYLIPSGLDNMARGMKIGTNVNRWKADSGINKGFIEEGYVLFESTEFQIKKKKMQVLGQLVNPGFSSPVKVYFDPFANETMSVGVGGLTVAGGIAKSYYVKKGDGTAVKFTKKEYDKAFETIYDNCVELAKEYEELAWRDFAKHLYFYSTECN